MADLGITKTHSRPHVSDDNPYSESHFRTLKYRPGFPERFGSLQDARSFSQEFFAWYNDEHRHSGLGLLSPAVVHHGLAPEAIERRRAVLDAAYALIPSGSFASHLNHFRRRTRSGSTNHNKLQRIKLSKLSSECLKYVDTRRIVQLAAKPFVRCSLGASRRSRPSSQCSRPTTWPNWNGMLVEGEYAQTSNRHCYRTVAAKTFFSAV